jgi:hypothetical protein
MATSTAKPDMAHHSDAAAQPAPSAPFQAMHKIRLITATALFVGGFVVVRYAF